MKTCKMCSKPLIDLSHGGTKKFCNSNCQMQFWRQTAQYKSTAAKYFQDNKAALQSKRTKLHRERYKTDIQYRLKDVLRSRLLKAFKKNSKSGSAIKDLNCSIEEFKKYLESKFQPGMSWDNYGKGKDKWNIDHILPLKDFNLLNPLEVSRACCYTNLQPIWELDHYRKTAGEAL